MVPRARVSTVNEMKLSDWQTESLRLSAFMRNPLEPAARTFWESLVGLPPPESRAGGGSPSGNTRLDPMLPAVEIDRDVHDLIGVRLF